MKKNTASQIIGAQMITAADGTAFTGSVTCYYTLDGGAQTIGSVGSGICTHEGNGFHTYTPTAGETNGDHVAYTFIGTGAIPATVQGYTTFPQTGDNYARLGAPAGASVSADVAAVKVDTAAILVDTGTTLDARIPAALVGGRMDVSVGAMANDVITAAATATDFGAEIADAVWDEELTGATHNVTNSAGKRLRQIDAAFEVHSGTAAAGAASTITLDGAASAINNIYNGDRVVIVGGTGIGEHGIITAYNGTTKVATMSKAWVITPDATSEFAILPADTDIETWNNVTVTGDGDWAQLQTDVDAILVDTAEIGAAGAGLTALATQASVNTIDDYLDTEIAAIKAKTDSLTFTKAGEIDANIQSVNGVTVNGDGAGTPMGV